jgi:hypothetical protein
MKCNICGQATRRIFSHAILGKYECAYFYCDACGFLQTEEPHWLNEAYTSAIAEADTGLVRRNIQLSGILAPLLFFVFGRERKYLDVAGGYGLLARLMRDAGFDFYWSDKYCENLLARGFEGVAGAGYTAVTAFEVLEHLHDPLGFIAETLAQAHTRTFIFSTELFAGEPPRPDAWWYYTFDTGQHISFFQLKTLRVMGEKLGLNCYSNGWMHMLTDQKIGQTGFGLLTSRRASPPLNWWLRRRMVPGMMADHRFIMGKNR